MIAARGQTVGRLRNGALLERFASPLPAGGPGQPAGDDNFCILDCIFHAPDQTYYVLGAGPPLPCWAQTLPFAASRCFVPNSFCCTKARIGRPWLPVAVHKVTAAPHLLQLSGILARLHLSRACGCLPALVQAAPLSADCWPACCTSWRLLPCRPDVLEGL